MSNPGFALVDMSEKKHPGIFSMPGLPGLNLSHGPGVGSATIPGATGFAPLTGYNAGSSTWAWSEGANAPTVHQTPMYTKGEDTQRNCQPGTLCYVYTPDHDTSNESGVRRAVSARHVYLSISAFNERLRSKEFRDAYANGEDGFSCAKLRRHWKLRGVRTDFPVESQMERTEMVANWIVAGRARIRDLFCHDGRRVQVGENLYVIMKRFPYFPPIRMPDAAFAVDSKSENAPGQHTDFMWQAVPVHFPTRNGPSSAMYIDSNGIGDYEFVANTNDIFPNGQPDLTNYERARKCLLKADPQETLELPELEVMLGIKAA